MNDSFIFPMVTIEGGSRYGYRIYFNGEDVAVMNGSPRGNEKYTVRFYNDFGKQPPHMLEFDTAKERNAYVRGVAYGVYYYNATQAVNDDGSL